MTAQSQRAISETDCKRQSQLVSAIDLSLSNGSSKMPDNAQFGFNALLQTPYVMLKSDEFDMEFEIPFDDDIIANEATFTVYNLSNSTINKFKVGNSISLTAGYEKDTGMIFQGFISKVATNKSGLDKVTTIYALDDVKYTPDMTNETTYTAGTKASTILKDLINRLGLTIEVFNPKRDYTFEEETKIEGSLSENIKTYSDLCGVSTYICKQKVYSRAYNDGDNIHFNVNKDTGMIESPEPFEEDNQNQEYVDITRGYNVKMLLQHRMTTASIVNLNSNEYNGEYRIRSGVHEYDGLSAITKFKCIDTVSTILLEKGETYNRSTSGKLDDSVVDWGSTVDGSGGVVGKAVAWALKIANDDSHGYSQTVRWGVHYDCSSFVISAYQQAGVPVKSKGASTTQSMYTPFIQCGFKDVTSSINLSTGAGLKKGDVLLNTNHHAALVRANGGAIVHASNPTNGILTRSYYNYPWDYVLRYKG